VAKDVTGNPWIFDAETQAEGYAPYEAGETVNTRTPIFVKEIKVYTGTAGGDVQIHDESGGREVLFLDSTPANTTISVPFGNGVWLKGIYITDLQTAAKVYVYHGAPSSGSR